MSRLITVTALRKAFSKGTHEDDLNISDTIMGFLGSATFNPANLIDGAGETTTVTATGAALGDMALASFSLDLQGIILTAYVSAVNTVAVRFQNETTGTINLSSGTLRVKVIKAV